jgi:TonB family protein
LLSLLVDENGQPQNIKVLAPLGYGLDENAVNAIKTWRFAPGTKDGKAVAVPVTVEVSFHLYNSGIGRVDVEPNTMDETIDAYLSPIVAEAGKCWSRVTSDEKRSPGVKQARLTVQFAISRDGHVHTVEIVSSSGDEILDGMARDCINGLIVNKPLPPNVNRDHLIVNVPMLYNTDGPSINPPVARLLAGEKEQFYVSTAGELSVLARWSVTGAGCTTDACGSISPGGLYTAPSVLPDPPFVRIKAALQGANPLSASSIVMLFKKQEAAPQTPKR